MWKWVSAGAALIAASTVIIAALRIRLRRRRHEVRIDQEELNQWFRRHN